MADSPNELRACPTRIDGTDVLFAHKVSDAQCQERQRGRYHKCFTCAYNNAYVAVNGLPAATAEKAKPRPQAVRVG